MTFTHLMALLICNLYDFSYYISSHIYIYIYIYIYPSASNLLIESSALHHTHEMILTRNKFYFILFELKWCLI
ncbi:MAG: hypothetical protein N7Q72_04140, partial [Spiroplasma sp. Tabriz.8]|nr:hypothetical protein [Candidatus Karelsulcia muelleri]MCZ8632435.1 hypothetical protein [Spiroplasma sp. Tabriz.8]